MNLARLLGFGSEWPRQFLVYEFVKDGSLDNFRFTMEELKSLAWESRFRIALGTARGITYLHEECRDLLCIVM